MFTEYNWTAKCWQFRFGNTFIDVNGYRSCKDLTEVDYILSVVGLRRSKKTDSRVWSIEAI